MSSEIEEHEQIDTVEFKGTSPNPRKKKTVSFASETQFIERQYAPPVQITHTAITKIAYHGCKWNIGRRYRHFEDNHKRMILEKVLPKKDLPKLPKKRSYRSFASWKNKIGRTLTKGTGTELEERFEDYEHDRIEERKHQLELYITELLGNHTLVSGSRVLRRFLEISDVAINRARSNSEPIVGTVSGSVSNDAEANAAKFDVDVPALPSSEYDNDDNDSSEIDAAEDIDARRGEEEGHEIILDGLVEIGRENILPPNSMRLTQALHASQKFVEYRIEFHYFDRQWSIIRRYRQFAENHKRLLREKIVPASDLPPLPQKKTLVRWKNRLKNAVPRRRSSSADSTEGSVEEEGGSSDDVSGSRLAEIEAYVTALFALPVLLQDSQVMKQFFELPSVAASEVDAFVSKIADMSLWSDAIDTAKGKEEDLQQLLPTQIEAPPSLPKPGVDVSFV